jgi:hypothetical protein
MATVRKRYSPAVTALPGGGSDITAQYRRAGEWAAQLGGSFRLHLYLLTDGLQNVERRVDGRVFDVRRAESLARETPVPRLSAASVTVAGLGRVAAKPPRSTVVEGLVAYYLGLCKKTGATSCLAVTDYAQAGR